MKLQINKKYIFRINTGSQTLKITGKLLSIEEPFISIENKDPNREPLYYTLSSLISVEVIK